MDYVKETMKERCYDFCNNLDKISEVLDMDLYFDSIIAQFVDKKSRKSYPLWKLMNELDKLSDEKVQDILIKDSPRFNESDFKAIHPFDNYNSTL